MAFHDLFDLSGKRALVTGAAGGIGEAIAHALVAQGAFVVIADRAEEPLKKVASELHGSCEAHLFDQSDLSSVEQLAVAAGHIDILINNAGIAIRGPLIDLDFTDMRRVIDVNLVGPIALTKLIGPALIQRGNGTVINISSQMAFTGANHRSVYAASKMAISQFTKTAALEWGKHGIRVNCIAPGRTITPINSEVFADPAEYEAGLRHIPLNRYGQPEDIANAAVFLASEAAAYITGQTLIVDGGWVLQ